MGIWILYKLKIWLWRFFAIGILAVVWFAAEDADLVEWILTMAVTLWGLRFIYRYMAYPVIYGAKWSKERQTITDESV